MGQTSKDKNHPFNFLSELLLKLSQPPQLAKPDEGPTLQLNLEDEDEEKEKEVNIDEDIAKNGSVACKYIELNPWHYTQEERHTYYQRSIQSVLCLVNLLIDDCSRGNVNLHGLFPGRKQQTKNLL